VIDLPAKFLYELSEMPETGMGYQMVSVILADGRRYDRVVVIEGRISSINGLKTVPWATSDKDIIPFTTADIVDVILTHEK
jgi:hypothetical protein